MCTYVAGYTGVYHETGSSLGEYAPLWLGIHEYILRQIHHAIGICELVWVDIKEYIVRT